MDAKPPLLDAHEAPPSGLKELYKRYQKLKLEDLAFDTEVLDFSKARLGDDIEILKPIPSSHLESIFSRFVKEEDNNFFITQDAAVYGYKRLPGKNPFSNTVIECYNFPFQVIIFESYRPCQRFIESNGGRSPHTSGAASNKRAR